MSTTSETRTAETTASPPPPADVQRLGTPAALPSGFTAWAQRYVSVIPAIVILGLVLGLGSSFHLYLAGMVLIYATAAVGLDWLMGRAGQISIGTAAMLCIGGYTAALTSTNSWAPFPVPLLFAAVAGGAIGLIVGLPALRLVGIYLALATMGLQFIIQFAAEQYQARSGQVSGLAIAPPELFGYTFAYGRAYVVLLAVILGIVCLILTNMFRRAPGRNWNAIRESELAASTIGVSATRWKLIAFVGSSMVISLAGAMLAYYSMRVSAEAFTLDLAIEFIIMIVIGGRGSIWGAIVGASVISLAPHILTWLTGMLPANFILTEWIQSNVFLINNGLYGLIVLLFLLYQPQGIVPGLRRMWDWAFAKLRPSDTVVLAGATATAASSTATVTSTPVSAATARSSVAPTSSSSATVPVATDPVATVPVATVADRPSDPAANGHHRTAPTIASTGTALLTVRGLDLRYANGALALDQADLEVNEGEIIAIVGRNGAGKTSLLRAITGFFPSERVRLSGSVMFDGEEIIGSLPMKSSNKGIVLVPERDKVFPSLTVAEHLKFLGNQELAREALPESAFELFERRWDSPAGLLSGGERQLLAISIGASLQPKLMLIDEMSLGLAPSMIDMVTRAVAEMQERTGIGIVVVEQNAAVAERLASRALRIETGRVVVDTNIEEEAHAVPAADLTDGHDSAGAPR